MGDADRRELQRSFTSEEEEAAWLVDRLRAGELDEERVRLAAWCGHRPASLAISEDLSGLSQVEWLESIPIHSELRKRVAVAAGRFGYEAWLRDHPDWVREFAERLASRSPEEVFLTEVVLRSPLAPAPATEARPGELEEILWEGIEGVLVTSSVRYDRVLRLIQATTTGGFAASAAVCDGALAASEHRGRVVTSELQAVLGNAAQAWEVPGSSTILERSVREIRADARLPLEKIPDSPTLRERVRAEVVPWLLGRKRPLLVLVAQRKMGIDLSQLC